MNENRVLISSCEANCHGLACDAKLAKPWIGSLECSGAYKDRSRHSASIDVQPYANKSPKSNCDRGLSAFTKTPRG
jgi:hypothetical protein